MYLNGLTKKKLTNDILLYADNTTLYASHTIRNADVVQSFLQDDLDAIYDYGTKLAITFNPSKTVQQHFTRKKERKCLKLNFGRQNIPVTTNHKHLGLTLSEDLRFHTHINSTLRKMNKALGPIYPLAMFLPRSTIRNLYITYIRPYHDYCDIIFDGHITTHDSIRLERFQNRVARLITCTPLRTSSDRLRSDIGCETLKIRREIHRLISFHRLIQSPNTPSYIKSILPTTRT